MISETVGQLAIEFTAKNSEFLRGAIGVRDGSRVAGQAMGELSRHAVEVQRSLDRAAASAAASQRSYRAFADSLNAVSGMGGVTPATAAFASRMRGGSLENEFSQAERGAIRLGVAMAAIRKTSDGIGTAIDSWGETAKIFERNANAFEQTASALRSTLASLPIVGGVMAGTFDAGSSLGDAMGLSRGIELWIEGVTKSGMFARSPQGGGRSSDAQIADENAAINAAIARNSAALRAAQDAAAIDQARATGPNALAAAEYEIARRNAQEQFNELRAGTPAGVDTTAIDMAERLEMASIERVYRAKMDLYEKEGMEIVRRIEQREQAEREAIGRTILARIREEERINADIESNSARVQASELRSQGREIEARLIELNQRYNQLRRGANAEQSASLNEQQAREEAIIRGDGGLRSAARRGGNFVDLLSASRSLQSQVFGSVERETLQVAQKTASNTAKTADAVTAQTKILESVAQKLPGAAVYAA